MLPGIGPGGELQVLELGGSIHDGGVDRFGGDGEKDGWTEFR